MKESIECRNDGKRTTLRARAPGPLFLVFVRAIQQRGDAYRINQGIETTVPDDQIIGNVNAVNRRARERKVTRHTELAERERERDGSYFATVIVLWKVIAKYIYIYVRPSIASIPIATGFLAPVTRTKRAR